MENEIPEMPDWLLATFREAYRCHNIDEILDLNRFWYSHLAFIKKHPDVILDYDEDE